MPSKIYHMSFNTTSTLLCVSSATDTIHIFKLSPQKPEEEDMGAGSSDESDIHRTSSEPSLTDTSITSTASQQTPDIGSRKPNGSFMGIIRRTSQTVGSSLANKVGGYLPKGVTEMWEPARDFAWIRLPKSPGPHANGQGNGAGSKSVRSIVAMCPNTPQAMVITSDGNFYVYDVDLSKGGEGTLVQQHSCVN
ncbi:autophagy protein [Ascosphaera atra]|nr:autophagy protein [Ascosphaera atra]